MFHRNSFVFFTLLTSFLPLEAAEKAPTTDLSGDPLPAGVVARMGTSRFHHGDLINAVAYSGDGTIIASASHDRTVRLWEAQSGKQIRVLTGHTNYIGAIAFSSDGKMLASGSADLTVRLWEVESGREVRAIKANHGATSVAFAPNGATVASGGTDSEIHLWETKSGDKIRSLKHGGIVRSLAYSPDGKLLVSGGQDQALRFWDPATGKDLHKLENRLALAFGTWSPPLTFSKDGKMLAAVFGEKLALVIDPESFKVKQKWYATGSQIAAIALSDDGKNIATAALDGVQIWNCEDGKKVRTIGPVRTSVRSMAFSPDGKTLACAEANAIRLWDAGSGDEKLYDWAHFGWIKSLAIAPNDMMVATAGWDGTVRLWDLTGKELKRLSAHSRGANGVAFSPDGSLLASCGDDDAIILWNPKTGKEVRKIIGKQSTHEFLAWSPDAGTLAVCGKESTIQLWDPATGKSKSEVGSHQGGNIRPLVWSKDGKLLASKGQDTVVRIWGIPEGNQQHELKSGLVGGGHAFTPDGSAIAVSVAKAIQVFELKLGRKILDVSAGPRVWALTYSPDGKFLAACEENLLVLRDARTGKELKRFQGHLGPAYSVAFTRDSKRVLSAGRDGSVLVWNVPGADSSELLTGNNTESLLPPGAESRLGSSLLSHGSHVSALGFSADGKVLVSAGQDGQLRIWDGQTGKQTGRIKTIEKRIANVRFAADGQSLLVVGWNEAIWHLFPSGKEKERIGVGQEIGNPFAVSPDGKLFAYRVADNTIHIRDASGKLNLNLVGHTDAPASLAFSPDGKILLSGSADQTIRGWDTSSGKEISNWSGHNGTVNLVKFSPGGKLVVSAATKDSVRLWKIETGENYAKLPAVLPTAVMDFAANGKAIACSASGGGVTLHDLTNGELLKQWTGPGGTISAIACSKDGSIATATTDGRISLWDPTEGKMKIRAAGHLMPLNQVHLLPDRKGYVTASLDGTAVGWDANGKERWVVEGLAKGSPSASHSAAVSPDGRVLAARKANSGIGLYDTTTGKETASIPSRALSGIAGALTFSPDSSMLASVESDGSLRLLDAATGKENLAITTLPMFRKDCLTISPDGRLLAGLLNSEGIWIWDLVNQKQLHVLHLNRTRFHCLHFSPDGRTIGVGANGKIYLIEASTGKLRTTLTCEIDRPVNCLLFSRNGRVLIAGDDSKLQCFDLLIDKSFTEVDSSGSIQCMACDRGERRLITGQSDGTALIWDFAGLLSKVLPLETGETSSAKVDQLWANLIGDNSLDAWHAVRFFATSPKQTVAMFKKRAGTIRVDPKRLARLLADLDADDFNLRDLAVDALVDLGWRIEAEVRAALKKESKVEVQRRLEIVINRIEKTPKVKGIADEIVLVGRIIEVLQLMDGPEGRGLLQEWAKTAPLPALSEEAKVALRMDKYSTKQP